MKANNSALWAVNRSGIGQYEFINLQKLIGEMTKNKKVHYFEMAETVLLQHKLIKSMPSAAEIMAKELLLEEDRQQRQRNQQIAAEKAAKRQIKLEQEHRQKENARQRQQQKRAKQDAENAQKRERQLGSEGPSFVEKTRKIVYHHGIFGRCPSLGEMDDEFIDHLEIFKTNLCSNAGH